MIRRCVLLFVAASVPLLLSASGPARPMTEDLKVLAGANPPPGAIWLDSLDLTRMVQRRGTLEPEDPALDAATIRRRCPSLAFPISTA